jgi:hypothetical protein
MKLLTVGDSFTYGEELEDRKSAWPFLLANTINFEVTNLGQPSKSNTYILRTVVEQCLDYDLIIVAWSHFARLEFSDNIGTYDIWPGCNKHQAEVSKWRKHIIDYITLHHNDEYLYTQYLMNIVLLQNFLKQHNKKYIMLDAFGNTKVRNLNLNLTKLINTTYYPGWPNESMMEWTYGTPKGKYGHFLEQGHRIVADKIYEHIRHLGWIS